MLIHRRPSRSTTSTFGSVAGAGRAASTRARAERLRRGFGRLGIASERVVQHVHTGDSTWAHWYPARLHSRCIKRGGGKWPYEAPATARWRSPDRRGKGAKSIGHAVRKM